MIRISASKIIVVASATSSIPVPSNKQVVHITHFDRIFPAIHEMQPNGILLDYDYLSTHVEKVLRRLQANPFYSKIKIYCYKSKPNIKADGLLKALGVQYFIYGADLEPKQPNAAFKALSEIVEARVVGVLVEAAV